MRGPWRAVYRPWRAACGSGARSRCFRARSRSCRVIARARGRSRSRRRTLAATRRQCPTTFCGQVCSLCAPRASASAPFSCSDATAKPWRSSGRRRPKSWAWAPGYVVSHDRAAPSTCPCRSRRVHARHGANGPRGGGRRPEHNHFHDPGRDQRAARLPTYAPPAHPPQPTPRPRWRAGQPHGLAPPHPC